MARIDYANKPLTEFVTDIAEGIVIAEGGSVGNNTSIHPGDFQDRISALKLEENSSGYRLADASDILNDRVAWGTDRQLIKGTIVNQGGYNKELTHDTPSIMLQPGYYSGGEISAIVYPNTKYITITPDNPYPNAQAYEEDIDDISGLPRGYLGYPQISVQYSGATYNVNNPAESDSIAGYEFIHVPAGSVSVSGGVLVPTGFTGTPTLTLGKGEDSGALGAFGYSANKPTSDDVYYVPIVANSVEFTGKTKATRSAVTVAQMAGVIEQQNATTVINASSVEPSVTINAGSATGYITIGKAVRATNNVKIDLYADNDYEYVEIQVSNDQKTGYVNGGNEVSTIELHEKINNNQHIVSTIYNGKETECFNYISPPPSLQPKEVTTLYSTPQTISADDGYDGLSSVVISATKGLKPATAISVSSSGGKLSISATNPKIETYDYVTNEEKTSDSMSVFLEASSTDNKVYIKTREGTTTTSYENSIYTSVNTSSISSVKPNMIINTNDGYIEAVTNVSSAGWISSGETKSDGLDDIQFTVESSDQKLEFGSSLTYNGLYYFENVTINTPSLADVTPATAQAQHILDGYTAWVDGSQIMGTYTPPEPNLTSITVYPRSAIYYPGKGDYDGWNSIRVEAIPTPTLEWKGTKVTPKVFQRYYNETVYGNEVDVKDYVGTAIDIIGSTEQSCNIEVWYLDDEGNETYITVGNGDSNSINNLDIIRITAS